MKTIIRAIRKIKRSHIPILIVNTIMLTAASAYVLLMFYMMWTFI